MFCKPPAMASVIQSIPASESPLSSNFVTRNRLSSSFFSPVLQRPCHRKVSDLHFSVRSNGLVVCSSFQLLFSVATATEATEQELISSSQVDVPHDTLDTASVSSAIDAPSFPSFPTRYAHIRELFLHMCAGSDVPSALDPWLEKLTLDDWNQLLLHCGYRDINIGKQILSVFREKESLLDRDVLLPTMRNERQALASKLETTSVISRESNAAGSQKTLENSVKAHPGAIIQEDWDEDYFEAESSQIDADRRSEFFSPCLKLYTTFANLLFRQRSFGEIDILEAEVKEAGLAPNVHYYNVLLHSYVERRSMTKAIELLHHMKSMGFEPHIRVYEELAFVYVSQADMDAEIFSGFVEDLRARNTTVLVPLYRRLLNAHWKANNLADSEKVFKALIETGHPPEQKNLLKLMQLNGRKGHHERVVELFDLMSQSGGEPNANAYSFLIHAYCKSGLLEKAQETLSKFDSVLGMKPTPITINMLIDGYGKQGLYKEALSMFEAISKYSYKPTWVSYSSIIAAMAKVGKVESAAQLYENMLRTGVQPNLHTYLILIRLYTKYNYTREGHKVYQALRSSTLKLTDTAYSVSLVLYVDGNWYLNAADLLKEIEEKGVALDALAHNALIRSFSYLDSKTTALARAVTESEIKICKVLASLSSGSLDNQELRLGITDAVYSVLEKWKKAPSLESRALVYNAFIDYFWKKNHKEIAKVILDLGRELYAGYSRPQLSETGWALDVRGLGVGGATVALRELLFGENMSLVKKCGDDTMITIITGNDFSLSLPQDNRKVNLEISSLLEKLGSPFEKSESGKDRLEAKLSEILNWVSEMRPIVHSSFYQ